MKVKYVSNIGRKRKNNQDSLIIGDKIVNSANMDRVKEMNSDANLFAVADGMGGYSYGEVASKDILTMLLEADEGLNNLKSIEVKLKEFQDNFAKADEIYSGMGTVLTGIKIMDNKVFMYNVGDSRTYRFRDGSLQVISRDHSKVYEYYLEGKISFDELRTHPEGSRVTSCYRALDRQLGLFDIKEFEYKKGDKYLICSDGLWEMIGHIELEALVKVEDAYGMLQRALENGGKDNITFILLTLD